MADKTEDIERIIDQFGTLADDAFRIVRLNIIIIGIYVSGIAAVSRIESDVILQRLIESNWTRLGLIIWLLSLIFAYFTYEPSRRASVPHLHEDADRIIAGTQTAVQSFKLRLSFLFSIIGAISLAIGVWDGFIPSNISFGLVYTGFMTLMTLGVGIILATRWSLRAYNIYLRFNDRASKEIRRLSPLSKREKP